MSNLNHSKNNKFLTELSEQEQEATAGGCAFAGLDFFFFQQTDIETTAENQTSISGMNGFSGSSLGRTGYRFSQTTLAFGSLFGGRRNRSYIRSPRASIFSHLFG